MVAPGVAKYELADINNSFEQLQIDSLLVLDVVHFSF